MEWTIPLDYTLVCIEPLSWLHISSYMQALHPDVMRALHITSLASEWHYLWQRLALQATGQTDFFCMIERQQQLCTVIGAIEVRNRAQHAGQLYMWLHPRYWGSGYMTHALYKVLLAYFMRTDERQVTARVDTYNKRSYGLLKKVGFADYASIYGPYGQQYELVFRNLWH